MKLSRFKIAYFDKQVLLKNIILSLVIAIIFMFLGLFISFIFLKFMPGDPVLAYLPTERPNPEDYAYWEHKLWLDRPLILQYFKYISELFTGNWGRSVSINRGQDVWSLLLSRTPRTIDVLLFPTILGLILGIILGKVSVKFRKTRTDKIIQGLIILGTSIPIFSFGIILQKYLAYDLGLFPVSGYKSSEYNDPELVTGFRIIDALISGEWYLISDYLYHLILPVLCLSIVTIALIAHQARSYNENISEEKSVFSNTMHTFWIFSLIFTFLLILEIIFGLNGLFEIFIQGIMEADYYVVRSSIFITLIMFTIIILISNIIFSILKSLTFDHKNTIDSKNYLENDDNTYSLDVNSENNSSRNIKNYLAYLIESPFTLIGMIIVIGIIILGSFPEIISGYPLEVVTNPPAIFPPQPPSKEHLFGTELIGRDVFALILWGIQYTLIISLETVIIGIIGGLIFGLISSINKNASKAIEVLMLFIYVIPPIILSISIVSMFGALNYYLMLTIGFLLIPFFTRIIKHFPLNKTNILISLKKLVIYIPFAFSFVILFYESIAFIGFSGSYFYIPLGSQIAEGESYIQAYPWIAIWPSFFLFFVTLGFIMLHYGLKDTFIYRLESKTLFENES